MFGAACYMWWGCGTSSHSSCWRRDQGTHGDTRHPTCFTFTSCLSIFPARTPIWRYGDISQPSHTCVDTGTPPESAINLPLSELLGFYFTFCLVCSIYLIMLGDVVQRQMVQCSGSCLQSVPAVSGMKHPNISAGSLLTPFLHSIPLFQHFLL